MLGSRDPFDKRFTSPLLNLKEILSAVIMVLMGQSGHTFAQVKAAQLLSYVQNHNLINIDEIKIPRLLFKIWIMSR